MPLGAPADVQFRILHRPQSLAARHLGTRFIKVHVANVPFLVVKLEIKVLPCVITFVDGVTRDKYVARNTDSVIRKRLIARLTLAQDRRIRRRWRRTE